ncbi:hypothetical protein LTS18_014495 [Coniosporium uncinatum]|uniref:Uncharacterized protein n=1 Tax=Coniosporium uncinatum TaxID=93489 RepID=A0ACC3CVQ3_9PEZI|nr:hypothetical protein LTS18_014495 [Coniosporium uncinatum]
MAPKRRTSGPITTRRSGQPTLAFHGNQNKVTKPSFSKPAHATKKDPALSESIVRTNLKAEADPDLEEPTTAEAAIYEQASRDAGRLQSKEKLTPDEEAAKQIPESQIKRYWRAKETARKAPRVHQEALRLGEKVCREFDTDGRFGPCMGIARIKRWKRAQGLGLQPPIEVLAVLIKEQEADNLRAQRAYVDELMSSRTIET